MKKSIMRKLLAIAGCVTLFCAVDAGVTWATTVTNLDASGTLVTPISITNDTPLSFGKFISDGSLQALVLDTSDSYGTPSTITTIVGPKSASFTITGTASLHYKVTLPSAAITLNDAGNAHQMTLDTFTSDRSQGTFDVDGKAPALKLGATLHVTAGQHDGAYSGKYDLTVEYD
jgi:hypothetical protein